MVDSCSFSVFALLRVENPAPSRTRGFRGFNRFPAITKHKFTTSIHQLDFASLILYVLSRVQGLTQFDNHLMAQSTSASAFGNKVLSVLPVPDLYHGVHMYCTCVACTVLVHIYVY